MDEEQLYLTDLIDVETLQKIQDAFCKMTNIAAGISDVNGVAVTKDTISTDFCMNFNKKSPIGRSRCEYCDKCGGEMALKNGHPVIYNCHTGMVDFAAPIMANGQMVGCFIGGQVRTGDVDEELLRKSALDIGADPDAYIAAAKKTKVVDQSYLKRATEFLYVISNVLSNIAYNKYLVLQASKEVAKAAQMKSDFLANMSHEIRTPMNAVIGMAEMALREELPPAARDYIIQIKSSGNTLLAIINDILDFSKIESGKMDINQEEYEPMSIINDVASIIMTRIGDKDVELILDIAPNLPRKLLGDCNRIKQIIVNLSNNAVKFTKKGQVVLSVDYQKRSEELIDFIVEVKDTGIGIKKEDLDKLFKSFQQVDSKRNRNIEGTGLGLAISKRLVNLMHGKIGVTSKYGEGSTFSFNIPQKIVDKEPSIVLKEPEKVRAAGFADNIFLRQHLKRDMEQLGISYFELDSDAKNSLRLLEENKVTHLFVGKQKYSEKIKDYVEKHPNLTAILMIDFRDSVDLNLCNFLVIKKPLYALNIATILNNEEVHLGLHTYQMEEFEFIAPEAEILVVDDNKINLTVTEGLLKPLKMNIETVLSGKEAIDKISKKHYDIIFMDHMMPELDGVETTHIIRRFHPEYDNVPIIALTANAVDGVRDMFIQEGMNDFVAKPIEIRNIVSKLRYWLPKEKIQKVSDEMLQNTDENSAKIQIKGLDTEAALKLLQSEDLFWEVLRDYYRVIEKKYQKIKYCEENEDIDTYTIEVHALKSASRQIGAMELGDMAAELEKAGHAKNIEMIHKQTDKLLEKYHEYYEILKPYCEVEKKSDTEKKQIEMETLRNLFETMRTAMDDLDMDEMENVIRQMEEYTYPEDQQDCLERLCAAAEDMDVDMCEAVIMEWELIL